MLWVDPLGLSCQKRDEKGRFTSETDPDSKSGRDYEIEVRDELARDPTVTILGTNVHVKTSKGDRYIDILYRDNKTDQIIALEVKSKTARRDKSQRDKDKLIDSGKGTFGSGTTVPDILKGQTTEGVTSQEKRVP